MFVFVMKLLMELNAFIYDNTRINRERKREKERERERKRERERQRDKEVLRV